MVIMIFVKQEVLAFLNYRLPRETQGTDKLPSFRLYTETGSSIQPGLYETHVLRWEQNRRYMGRPITTTMNK